MFNTLAPRLIRALAIAALVLGLVACNSSSDTASLSDSGATSATESNSDTGGTDTGGTDTGGTDTGGTDTGGTHTDGTDTGGTDTGGTDTGGTDTGGTDTGGTDTGGTDTATGVASLEWIAPIQRVNGDPLSLSEIGGYRVYSGVTQIDLKMVGQVDDPYQTSYEVTGLGPGTHYFYVTALDVDGLESPPSELKQKTF